MRSLSYPLAPLLVLALACSSKTEAVTPADTGSTDTGVDVAPETTACSSARETTLAPVDTVATGEVKLLDDTGGVRTIYIDAWAGGMSAAPSNPWVYVDLAKGARVDVNDRQSYVSADWDLAFKRATIHTNSGDAGVGAGGASYTTKAFDAVTAADATSTKVETWFDADCKALVDAIGSIKTTFNGWYDYGGSGSTVTPVARTWFVRGGKGDLYKMEIVTYYSGPDGVVRDSTSANAARYKIRVAALK